MSILLQGGRFKKRFNANFIVNGLSWLFKPTWQILLIS